MDITIQVPDVIQKDSREYAPTGEYRQLSVGGNEWWLNPSTNCLCRGGNVQGHKVAIYKETKESQIRLLRQEIIDIEQKIHNIKYENK